ncbi:TonB-dependent receptor [Glacieibacterium frigidum]|uniref:TonB-dependent receptor n=1 Tax=Glacieibacterium frigidum TaxID=2593303 RepID=A0A552U9N9_9SPHN|nr:TonB-dependent receptor [Glacieibacterium frigidum]TRW14937.1 TonB-dependent receptor [Glacieibacterium frigidum]
MRFDILRLLLSGVALAALAGPALAQTAAEPEDDGEIVVTALKREQTLLKVPVSIQAFSGAQLEEQGAKELNDLIESIPGASSVSRTAPGFETIQIRGIASGTTGDATVGYYVDDVPFSVPNLQLAPPSRLFDLERVEVLRGPQGTLYGQGAMGGTIRLVTASPDFDEILGRAQVEGSLTAGGEPSYAVDGVVNVPVAPGVAALRVSGGYESVGGFADLARPSGTGFAVTRKDVNDQESWNIRAKLGIKASDDVGIELGAWRVENTLDFRNTMDTADPPRYNDTTGPDGRPNFVNSNLTLLSGVINADLGFAKLTSSTSYIDSLLDFDASFLTAPGLGSGYLRNISRFKSTAFTQEVRLASSSDGPFGWLVGAYYSDGEIESDICLSVFLPCSTVFSVNINSFGTIKTKAWAVFGELSYKLFDDRLTLTAGGRQFRDRRRLTGLDRNTNVQTAQGDVFKTFNPRFNAAFQASDNFLVYTNVAKGFRSGSFQSASQAAAASAALGVPVDEAIQPDKVWSYEVGAKGKLFDGLVSLDAAIYQIDWSDIQLQSTISGVATLSNGGNARSKGIDLGLIIKPVGGLTLQLVGNINETEFTSVLPTIVAINPLAAPGSRIPNVPKSSVQVSANYAHDLTAWDAKGFINGSYSFRNTQLDSSGLESDELNEFKLRAGISKAGWKFQLFAENLTNTRVALTRAALGIQPNFPRRLGARFSIDF